MAFYHGHATAHTEDVTDPITYEATTKTPTSHPNQSIIIARRDVRTGESGRSFHYHAYNTFGLLNWIDLCMSHRNPTLLPNTMDPTCPLTKNEITRIKFYVESLTEFPDVTMRDLGMSDDSKMSEDVPFVKSICDEFFSTPIIDTESIVCKKFKHFITYGDVISYLNKGTLHNRAEAMALLMDAPVNTSIIRESSWQKYNLPDEEFFAISTKISTGYNHEVYCHRKGYGIFDAHTYVTETNDGGTIVTKYAFDIDAYQYHPSVGHLIVSKINLGYKFHRT